jgi:hypothetical protein
MLFVSVAMRLECRRGGVLIVKMPARMEREREAPARAAYGAQARSGRLKIQAGMTSHL